MWTPFVVEEVMRRSRPTVERVEVAKDWEATVEPLREVIDPPAPPASVPQVNVPLAQRSFSVEELQAVKLAPKSDARVRPPVLDALLKYSDDAVSPVVDALVILACVEKSDGAVRTEVEALIRVVFPVTLSVEENVPVVPMSAP